MKHGLSLLASIAFLIAGCQITVEDLTPIEFRKGGGGVEKPEPEPTPEPLPKPPKPTSKDVIYILGITGMD
ncbi:MAG: hypothetical protein IT462_13395 [Planctomycetes bacterium]|nr:hypothetical protein [Planctomycetota bacterium]